MSGKTLSNGVLGLRFMQNAQRAKDLKEEQLAKAKIKDEAEWEIPQKTWPKSDDLRESVTYESSYLPFIFPSGSNAEAGPSTGKIHGRRIFNAGKELEQPPDSATAPVPTPDTPPDSTESRRKGVRPLLRADPRKDSKREGKTARQAIFDNAGVGDDLPAQRATDRQVPSAEPAVFLKPAGVDEPARPPDGVLNGARKSKNKRRTDATEESRQKKRKAE